MMQPEIADVKRARITATLTHGLVSRVNDQLLKTIGQLRYNVLGQECLHVAGREDS